MLPNLPKLSVLFIFVCFLKVQLCYCLRFSVYFRIFGEGSRFISLLMPQVLSLSTCFCQRVSVYLRVYAKGSHFIHVILRKVLSLSPCLCQRFSVYFRDFVKGSQFISVFMPKVLSLSPWFFWRFSVYNRFSVHLLVFAEGSQLISTFMPKVLSLSACFCWRFSVYLSVFDEVSPFISCFCQMFLVYLHVFAEGSQFNSVFLPKVLSLSTCFCWRFSVFLHVYAEGSQFITVFLPKVHSLSPRFCHRICEFHLFSCLCLFSTKKVKFYNTSSSLFSFRLQTQNPSHFEGQINKNQNLSIMILYTFSKILTLKFHTFLGTRGVKLLPGLGWPRTNFKMLFIKKRRLQYLCCFKLKYPTASYLYEYFCIVNLCNYVW